MVMKEKRLLLILISIVCLYLFTVFSVFASAGDTIQTVGDMVEIEGNLSDYRLGDVQRISDDGYIGIPVQLSVYCNDASKVTAGVGGTPVIFYVVNTNIERVGTDSDTDIISSMLDRGYVVITVDYLQNEKAVSPALDYSMQQLRSELVTGTYFEGMGLPVAEYKEVFVVPAGYDVSLYNVYWEIDKHSAEGTLEYIVEVWNEDFRSVFGNRVIKWTDENGDRKATQTAYDGTSPVWLSADGTENENGDYIKIKYTKATEVTDCTRIDGSALDYNLYMHVTYPTNPEGDAPVMCLAGSGDHLASVPQSKDRPHFNGFLFNGYVGVLYDHGYVPMARRESYNEFSGTDSNAVTGDNVTYSISFYNDKKIHTAAMRFLRYLAASDSAFAFDTEAIGVYGNSKGGWMTFLGEEHPELLPEKRFFPGHHGETRYEAGKTEDVGIIDGGEEQPWLTYNGVTLDSGADLIYACCGGAEEHITDGHAPTFISCNSADEWGSFFGASNNFVNACRVHDVPTLWVEASVGHMFTYGPDINYGFDTYDALFTFCGYYLKGEAVKVVYTSYGKTSENISPCTHPIVKFSGAVSASEVEKITVTSVNGEAVTGSWSSLYGNTEWTFTPDGALDLATVYTITVPAGIQGDNGKGSAEEYTTVFTVADERQKTVSSVEGVDGTFYYFTVDESNLGADIFNLRFAVENDAANLVKLYPATSFDPENPDAALVSNEAIAQFGVFGKGYYECDVSSYASALGIGQVAAFLVKAEREAGVTTAFSAPLDSKLDVTAGNYVSYEFVTDVEGIEGSGALKITDISTMSTSGSRESVVFYANSTNLITANSIVKSANLDESDLGRSFNVSFRIYDTASRRLQVYLRSATSEKYGIADYNAQRYNLTTKAGEWMEVSLDFTIHEPLFGAGGNIRKALFIDAGTFGDNSGDYPIYIDTIETVETVTDVTFGEVTLVCSESVVDPLVTEYGRIDDAFVSIERYPLAVFLKNGSEWEFEKGLAKIPTSFNYGADAVILFRANMATTSSKYNIDSIGAGNSLTFDLNGYTLDITNGDRYSAITTEAKADGVTFSVKNGDVYTDGMASLVCIYARGNNTVNLNFENLDITVGAAYGETSPLIRHGYDAAPVYKSTYNITFTDCDVDISAAPDPSALNVWVAGYSAERGNYSLNWQINGGSLNTGAAAFSTKHIRIASAGKLTLGRGSDGEYLKMIYTADLDNAMASASFTDEDGKTRYFGAVSTDGTSYVHQPMILATEYGTIPTSKLSALKYPFASFYNGTFKVADDFFANASIEWNLRALDGAVVVMRRDYSVPYDKTYQNLSHHQGELVIDLMGYTLDGTSASYNGVFSSTGMNTFETDLVVKNGRIVIDSYLFVATARSGVEGKIQGFKFEKVEIDTSASALINYATPKSASTLNIEFDDCTVSSDTLTTLFRAGFSATDTYLTTNLTVKGGEYTLNKFDQDKFVIEHNGGRVSFLPDADGDVTVVNVPTGTAMNGTAYKGEGDAAVYLVEYSNNPTHDEYRPESLVTPYGAIPYDKSSRVDYVFHAFEDKGNGIYVYKASNADYFKSGGIEWTLRSVEKSVVLMRRDFITSKEHTNISLNPYHTTIDLGGYTLTPGNMYGALAAIGKNNTKTSLTFENGTVLLDKYHLVVFGASSVGAGKIFNVTFSDLTFAFAEGATVSSVYGLIPHITGVSTNFASEFYANIDFVNCVFDMAENRPESFTLMYTEENKGLFHADVTLSGCELVASDLEGLSIADDISNLTLYRHNGKYLAVKLDVDATAPEGSFTTDVGEMTYVKVGAEDEYDVYELRDLTKLVTPKVSLTISSGFTYNIYVPVEDYVAAITVNGTAVDLGTLATKEIGDKSYYHVTVDVSVIKTAEAIALTVTTDAQSQSWTLDVIDYAEALATGNYDGTTEALAYDILAYIRAAYVYANVEDTAKAVERIDAVIGEDYVIDPDTTDVAKHAGDGIASSGLFLTETPVYVFYPEMNEDGTTKYDVNAYKFFINGADVTTAVDVIDDKVAILVYTYAASITETVSYTIEGTDISGEYNLAAYLAYTETLGDANLVALVNALWQYSDSAKAYIEAHE